MPVEIRSKGIPLGPRLRLIRDLLSGAVIIQRRKERGVGAGPPRTVISADAAAGADIHAIALDLAIKDHPDMKFVFATGIWSAEGWLDQAIGVWTARQRQGRSCDLLSEIDTWKRKARRSLKAYDHLSTQFCLIAN